MDKKDNKPNSTVPAVRQDTSLSPTSRNAIEALEAFADATVGLDAALVKYTRGDWTMGVDGDPIHAEDRFIALVPGMRHGNVKWDNSKPVARRMLLVADHPEEPPRNELGDLDREAWPRNKDGEPVDPWQATSELPLLDFETHAPRLYTTSSNGGRQALGKLARACAQQARKSGPGQLPVIGLGSESYKHKSYGNVDKPLLLIFDWIDDPSGSPAGASAGGGGGGSSGGGSYAEELDDAIPFEMPWK